MENVGAAPRVVVVDVAGRRLQRCGEAFGDLAAEAGGVVDLALGEYGQVVDQLRGLFDGGAVRICVLLFGAGVGVAQGGDEGMTGIEFEDACGAGDELAGGAVDLLQLRGEVVDVADDAGGEVVSRVESRVSFTCSPRVSVRKESSGANCSFSPSACSISFSPSSCAWGRSTWPLAIERRGLPSNSVTWSTQTSSIGSARTSTS